MFTPQQQQELNTIQANIRAAMDDLQTQIDELREELQKQKEHNHG